MVLSFYSEQSRANDLGRTSFAAVQFWLWKDEEPRSTDCDSQLAFLTDVVLVFLVDCLFHTAQARY